MKFERKPEIAIGERQIRNERGLRTLQKLISESAGRLLYGLENGTPPAVVARRLQDLDRKVRRLRKLDPSGETAELLASHPRETRIANRRGY